MIVSNGKAGEPNSILASAKILTGARIDDPKVEGWQAKMWHYYDTIGEFRRGIDWVAAACSQIPLIAAERKEAGDDPSPIEDGEAADLVAQMGGGMGGHKELIEEAIRHLLVVGITYLVVTENGQRWEVCSAEEIKRSSTGGAIYDILRDGDKWESLGDATVVRVHVPDPKRKWRPTCIAKSCMPILREIELISDHIQSTMVNRVAGAGVLVIPQEVTFPGSAEAKASGADPFVFDLIETMTTAIQSGNSAARFVPMVIKVPGQYIKDIKHITLTTPYDERTSQERKEAIHRLAASMYIEAEVLTGTSEMNHWGMWHVDEQTLTMHIKPLMGSLCADVTVGYFQPSLGAISETGLPAIGAPIVWYDASKLKVRPDLSEDTLSAYDRGEASGEALRREIGLDEKDAPTPEQLRDWALRQCIKSGDKDLLVGALQILGAQIELPESPAAPASVPPADDRQELPAPPETAPPDRPEEPPAQTPGAPGSAVRAALAAACDGLVFRALERGGNRLRQVAKLKGKLNCEAHLVHMSVQARAMPELQDSYLFQDAWSRVPEVALRHGVDEELLASALDKFCRVLVWDQIPYSFDSLERSLDVMVWQTLSPAA